MARWTLVVALSSALALVGCPGDPEDAGHVDDPDATDASVGVEPETTGGDVDPPDDTSPDAVTCQAYCDAVQVACTGDNAQYTSVAACLSYCSAHAQLPLGAAGDTAGNTVGCRLYHAGLAVAEPDDAAAHCAHAGASGGDVCGTWCENYCYLAGANCTGDRALYDDAVACGAACGGFGNDGLPGATVGDTVQCRIYHLGIAGSDGDNTAAIHCPHAAGDGGEVCVDAPPEPTCEAYCATVQTACTGEEAQYATEAACMDYCATWAQLPVGTAGDTEGNTIGCRTYHAGVAESSGDTALHCPHAGPSGGGVCGAWCDNYCDLAEANCQGEHALYGDGEACATACDGFASDATAGAIGGDSVQCRIYHLGVAGSDPDGDSAQTHCPHGAEDGGGVCVPPAASCEEYCADVTAACAGDLAQYEDEAACLTYCADWGALPLGLVGDTEGNTVGCRQYHAGAAAEGDEEAIAHCAHAGPSGGDVCGTWCDNYCHLALENCAVGDEALFGDADSCSAACEGYPTDGEPGATEGDSVQCKIYHLGVAGSDPDGGSAALHCPHGSVDGAGVCAPPPPTCADYCATVTAACTGELAQYADEASCVTYCETWATLPAGEVADVSGNTIGCRMYHAGVAATAEPEVHCPHAGPSGGDVCGTWCENYCALALGNCDGDEALFSGDEECAAACDALEADGLPEDVAGDSVQCRIYHLGVAGSDGETSAAIHCAHGDLDGGGVCVDPGSECAAAFPVDALPFSTEGDTSDASNAYGYGAGECPGEAGGWGNGSNDHVYAVVPDESAKYVITLTGDGFDTNLYVVTNCGDIAGTCLGADDKVGAGVAESLTLALEAGVTAYIVVDGWGNLSDASGAYALTVEKIPNPDCATYCAAVTAACTDANAQYADEASCLAYCDGGGKLVMGANEDTSGNTVGCRTYHAGVAATGPDEAAIHCAHAGPSGGDVCGTWCENYCALAAANCTGDAALYATDEACVEACTALPAGGSPGDVAGNSIQCRIYHLGVAGSDGDTSAAIHCPHGAVDGGGVCTPPAGELCEDPFDVGELPFIATGDTTGAENSYAYGAGECPGEVGGWGGGSSDHAYAFTAPAAGAYTIALTGTEFDTNLYVVSDCGDIGTTCLGADDKIGSNTTESLLVELTEGQTVFIVVDGWSNSSNAAGSYSLSVTHNIPTCASYCASITAACTGENAQYADEAACVSYCVEGAQLPIGAVADTAGNTVGCRTYHAGVAALSESSAATHCDHAGPSGGDVCGGWCDNYCHLAQSNCTGDTTLFDSAESCATACEAFAGDGSPGDVTGDTVQCRIYHLGAAGSDLAGAAALHCPHGGTDGGGVCAPDPGDTCATAIPVGPLPYQATGDTSASANDYSYGAGDCPGETGGWGAGSNDQVYLFTAPASKTYLFTLTGAGTDTNLYVASDCGDIAGTCLGADDDVGDGVTEELLIPLDAGATVYVFVDGWKNIGDESGPYTLEIAEVKPTCATYCEAVTSACAGEHAQYDSKAACLSYCDTWAKLPTGAQGDTSGNSIGCRSYHAGVAAGGPDMAAIHCEHAGPSGGDVCGTWCDNYCQLAVGNCTGDASLYADVDACNTVCGGLAADGAVDATSGDSVQCRIYHLGVAGSDGATSAAIHCPHGAEDGGGVCGDPEPSCAEYCAAITAACTGDNGQYASEAACLDYCGAGAQLPLGAVEDVAGNTVGCRTYHAGVAAGGEAMAAIHCAHAGPSGGDVCGTWCDNYCHLATNNCVGDDAIWASAGQCEVACTELASGGQPGDTSGDSVQCRIYHLGVAGSDVAGGSGAVHCPHGAQNGGGVCVEPAAAGDTCTTALPVGALPFTATGDTSALTDDYSFASGACPPETGGWGAGAPDRVYALTPESTAELAIGLADTGDWGASLYVVTDCASVNTSCVAGDEKLGAAEQVVVTLTGGTTYYIVVDGWGGGGGGAYTLTVAKTEPPAPTCTDYCDAVQANCTGPNAQYADAAACLDYCGAWAKLPPGTASDTSGNTLGCRIHQATAGTPDLSCDAAGPSGGGVCGSWCEGYCHLAKANCSGANALFPDDATCASACAAYAAGADPGATTGDTVQCRIYHLGVAGSDGATSAAIHCPHGGGDGGGVCVDAGTSGDACESAFEVDTMPFEATGDTTGAQDDYTFAAGSCPPETGGWGAGAPDHVYVFEAPLSAEIEISLLDDGAWGSSLYVVTDCGSVDATCVTGDEAIGPGGESVTFDAVAGTTYYIVVDGYGGGASGSYTLNVTAGTLPEPDALVINEIDYDQPSTDTAEFVELYNAGTTPIVLAGYRLEGVNGNDEAVYFTDQLADAGETLAPGAFLVVGQAAATDSVPATVATITHGSSFLQNAGAKADAVRVVRNADDLTVDAVSYEGTVPGASEGGSAGNDAGAESLARCPDGADTDDNSADFVETPPSPGLPNACAP